MPELPEKLEAVQLAGLVRDLVDVFLVLSLVPVPRVRRRSAAGCDRSRGS